MTPDPSAAPQFAARRVGSLQTLCQGVIVGVVGITVGFWIVVATIFGGVPIAGNLFRLGGVSVVVWAAALVSIAALVAAMMVGRSRGRVGLARVAAAHPELAGSAEEADRVFDVFAAVVFAEYAVAGGTALALAVTFHLTSLFPLLGFVAVLVLFLLMRYPTAGWAKVWLTAAQGRLDAMRPPSPR